MSAIAHEGLPRIHCERDDCEMMPITATGQGTSALITMGCACCGNEIELKEPFEDTLARYTEAGSICAQ